MREVKLKWDKGEGVAAVSGCRGENCWSGLCCAESWDGTGGSASCCPLPLTECLRGAPAAALALEEVVNVSLFLKVKGFPTLLS